VCNQSRLFGHLVYQHMQKRRLWCGIGKRECMGFYVARAMAEASRYSYPPMPYHTNECRPHCISSTLYAMIPVWRCGYATCSPKSDCFSQGLRVVQGCERAVDGSRADGKGVCRAVEQGKGFVGLQMIEGWLRKWSG
jgi:hypothetical protein